MKDCKRVKDPIYGYIKIPAIYMTDIVDRNILCKILISDSFNQFVMYLCIIMVFSKIKPY